MCPLIPPSLTSPQRYKISITLGGEKAFVSSKANKLQTPGMNCLRWMNFFSLQLLYFCFTEETWKMRRCLDLTSGDLKRIRLRHGRAFRAESLIYSCLWGNGVAAFSFLFFSPCQCKILRRMVALKDKRKWTLSEYKGEHECGCGDDGSHHSFHDASADVGCHSSTCATSSLIGGFWWSIKHPVIQSLESRPVRHAERFIFCAVVCVHLLHNPLIYWHTWGAAVCQGRCVARLHLAKHSIAICLFCSWLNDPRRPCTAAPAPFSSCNYSLYLLSSRGGPTSEHAAGCVACAFDMALLIWTVTLRLCAATVTLSHDWRAARLLVANLRHTRGTRCFLNRIVKSLSHWLHPKYGAFLN